jgi:hypothetical protein
MFFSAADVHHATILAFAEIGQAEPPEAEPKQAFERLIAFMKQHLAE